DRRAVLALALAATYTLYVVRVGGDFMFARLLIPVTPFLLVLLEEAWLRVLAGRLWLGLAVAAGTFAAVLATPIPVTGTEWRCGVADERAYYTDGRAERMERRAQVLGRYFAGLPVTVAFFGDEARLVYRVGFPVALEAHTGLTDRHVARQPLAARGRVGHEKVADPEYLIRERGALFAFSSVPERHGIYEKIPRVKLKFDEDVYGLLLHWDPRVVAALVDRGAILLDDFTGQLDQFIARIDAAPAEQVARIYRRLRLFYFESNADPAREAAFQRRLAAAGLERAPNQR
ncbi:MAG TPA: hypothetical protein VJS92_01985, partial [Candidatus Polarisedimenticolaceae bacterium]|nr:hypothetical protein [Candidatus Polarisedimenticolaceae bacterium]